MPTNLKILTLSTILCLFVLGACGPKPAPGTTTAQPGINLVGDWALAELRYAADHPNLANLVNTIGSRVTHSLRTHYTFKADGTCATQIWNNQRNTMMPGQTGTWAFQADGLTLDVALANGVTDRYTVKTSGNERLLYPFQRGSAQNDVAIVLVNPSTLPAPGSDADRTRRQAQVQRVANEIGNDVENRVNEWGDTLESAIDRNRRDN